MRPLVRFRVEDRAKDCADDVVMNQSSFRYVSYRHVLPRMADASITEYVKEDGTKTQKVIMRAIQGRNGTTVRKTKNTMYQDGKIDYIEKERVHSNKD